MKQENESKKSDQRNVGLSEKYLLTVKEVASYFGLGEKKLYELTSMPDCNYVLFVGNTKRLIKRQKFERYLETRYYV